MSSGWRWLARTYRISWTSSADNQKTYGADDSLVLEALLSLLRDVAWTAVTPDHRRAVADRLRRLRATVARQRFDDVERRRLDRVADRVDVTLNRSSLKCCDRRGTYCAVPARLTPISAEPSPICSLLITLRDPSDSSTTAPIRPHVAVAG